MILYMEVTKDEYQLPLAVADSVRELSRMCGASYNTIYSSMSHAKGNRRKVKYVKVVIDYDSE